MAHSHEAIDITDIEPIAYKYNGNVAAIAKKLNVSRQTIYQYFKRDPKGKELIDKVRGINTEYQLDLAELVINNNMRNYKINPGLAQRAAEKVIDKKGHHRGWENTIIPVPLNDSQVHSENADMEEKHLLRKENKELKAKFDNKP